MATAVRPVQSQAQPQSQEPDEETLTELRDIWQKAVTDYYLKTKKNEDELLAARDVKEAIEAQAQVQHTFQKKRHPDASKAAGAIQIAKSCSEWVRIGADFVAGNVSGSLVAPAQVVAGAIGLVVKATQGVSESLNLIESVFAEIHRAMQDATVFDDVPESKDFQRRLIQVFTATLDFCAFATNIFEKHARTRLFFASFSKLSDQVRAKAAEVRDAIDEFKSGLGVHTLASTTRIERAQNVFAREMRDLPLNLIASLKEAKLDPSMLSFTPGQTSVTKTIRDRWKKILTSSGQGKGSMTLLKQRFVEGTYDWVDSEKMYKDWRDGHSKTFLFIQGEAGHGKTYFTYSVQQRLRKASKQRQRAYVVTMFLGAEWSFQATFCEIICQIADQDQRVADMVLKKLREERLQKAEDVDPTKYWRDVVEKYFTKDASSTRVLYVLLDGIAESTNETAFEDMVALFKSLDSGRHSIQVMFTGAQNDFAAMEKDLQPDRLVLSGKTKTDVDMKKFIDYRWKNSPGLKKFSNKEELSKIIISRAEGDFSYVDICVSLIEPLRDEKEATSRVKSFEKEDKAVSAAMTNIVLSERSPRTRESLRWLYSWVALARTPLTVSELNHLLDMENKLTDFDVRTEIMGKSRIMLYIEPGTPEDITGFGLGHKVDATQDTQVSQDGQEVLDPEKAALKRKLNDGMYDFVRVRKDNIIAYLLGEDESGSDKAAEVNPLVGDITEMRVRIFIRMVNLICKSIADADLTIENLQSYAVHFLWDHFSDIELDDNKDKHIVRVVECLAAIFSNVYNSHLVFEEVLKRKGSRPPNSGWFPFKCYDLFNPVSSSNAVMQFVRRALLEGEEDLSPAARQWAKGMEKHPSRLLEPLAHGHIRSWLSKVTKSDAYVPYTLVYRTLFKLNYMHDPKGQVNFLYDDYDIPDTITLHVIRKAIRIMEKKMARQSSKKQSKITFASRASSNIAAAVVLNIASKPLKEIKDRKYAIEIEQRNQKNRAYAKALYEENLRDPDISGAELFYTRLGIGEGYAYTTLTRDEDMRDFSPAGREASLALAQRDTEGKGALGADLNNDRCIQAFSLVAYATAKAGRLEEAAGLYRDGFNELDKQSPRMQEFFNSYMRTLAMLEEWHEIMTQVRGLPRDFRAQWLSWRSMRWTGEFIYYDPWEKDYFNIDMDREYLRKAAVETRRTDLLVRLYQDAIDYWRNKSMSTAMTLQFDLSSIYRYDLRSSSMAKFQLNEIQFLSADVSGVGSEVLLRYVLERYADILHEEYAWTNSRTVKNACINDLSRLRDELISSDMLESWEQASIHLTLAKMLRGMNRIEAAKANAQEAFRLCIRDLEDQISANDQAAFCTLGVVLAFAGLYEHAEVALSLQFSKIDKAYEDDPDNIRAPVPQRPGAAFSEHESDDDISTVATSRSGSPIAVWEDSEESPTLELTQSPAEEQHMILGPEQGATPSAESSEAGPVTKDANVVRPKRPDVPSLSVDTKMTNGASTVKQDQNGKASSDTAPIPDGPSTKKNGLPGVPPSSKPQRSYFMPPLPRPRSGSARPSSRQSQSTRSWATSEVELDKYGELNTNVGRIACSGPCGNRSFDRYEEGCPRYRCLDCPNRTFCQQCYLRQMEFNDGTGDGFWTKMCWGEHKFLTQPIDGFQGVINGQIRRDGRSKPFREWLYEMKKRWNDAIENLKQEDGQPEITALTTRDLKREEDRLNAESRQRQIKQIETNKEKDLTGASVSRKSSKRDPTTAAATTAVRNTALPTATSPLPSSIPLPQSPPPPLPSLPPPMNGTWTRPPPLPTTNGVKEDAPIPTPRSALF